MNHSKPAASVQSALPPLTLITTATDNRYQVPLRFYVAAAPRANIVLMAALGVAARFYQPLAEELCCSGFNVALVEQRGHGDSSLRPSRNINFGFREALVDDIPAMCSVLSTRTEQGQPRLRR